VKLYKKNKRVTKASHSLFSFLTLKKKREKYKFWGSQGPTSGEFPGPFTAGFFLEAP
jgi:hypothetical protein